jgi:DNA-binding response OmpR family regulator
MKCSTLHEAGVPREGRIMGKILVIDDEPSIVRPLAFVLEKSGYEVLTAANGEEGLKVAEEERPDLIFLDVMMPKKNGYEVCQELREHPELKDVYVIILTARGVELDEKEKQQVKADEYMSKPFSPIRIVQHVNTILSERAVAAS